MITIGILGGTGDLGNALAIHLCKYYEKILIGSRLKERAARVIDDLISRSAMGEDATRKLKEHLVPATNQEVAALSDIVIAAFPYEGALEAVKGLSPSFREGQLFISAIAPVAKRGGHFVNPEESNPLSIAQRLKGFLPRSTKVATAFQTVPAKAIYDKSSVDADVFVSSEDFETYQSVQQIVQRVGGLRALYAGGLEMSKQLEGLTALLLNIGSKNHMKNPTFKITSLRPA